MLMIVHVHYMEHSYTIVWVVPPPSNSYHQDYYIFSRDPYKPSFATVTGRWDNPNYSYIIMIIIDILNVWDLPPWKTLNTRDSTPPDPWRYRTSGGSRCLLHLPGCHLEAGIMIRTLDGFLMIMDGRYKSIFHMYIFLVYIYLEREIWQ